MSAFRMTRAKLDFVNGDTGHLFAKQAAIIVGTKWMWANSGAVENMTGDYALTFPHAASTYSTQFNPVSLGGTVTSGDMTLGEPFNATFEHIDHELQMKADWLGMRVGVFDSGNLIIPVTEASRIKLIPNTPMSERTFGKQATHTIHLPHGKYQTIADFAAMLAKEIH